MRLPNSSAIKLYEKAFIIQTNLIEDPYGSYVKLEKPEVVDALEKLSIPQHEDVHNEFKSSWVYDYKADELLESGNTKDAEERKQNASQLSKLLKN